jgi:STE24 endopeptidase
MVPLEAYEMEIIDKKHKHVSRTLKTYLKDLVIDGILTLVFMLPVLYGYLRIVEVGGESYYFFLLVFTLVFTIVYVQVYPYMTIYFNKFKPVSDPELLSQIANLALKAHFPAEEIRIKVNGEYDEHGAEYRGIGTKHCIAVYESLLGRLGTREVGGVICHEMGHWYHRHSLKTLLLTLVLRA